MLHRIGQKVIINVDIIPSLYLLASFCKAEWTLRWATVQRELLRCSSECLVPIFGRRVPPPTTELLDKAERAFHFQSFFLPARKTQTLGTLQ